MSLPKQTVLKGPFQEQVRLYTLLTMGTIINSEQMYQAIKCLRRKIQLVIYPGEHHGIRRPSFQKDRFERFLGWYDKYVK